MENNISIHKTQLPDNIDDLSRFALVGREKLVAVRAEIRAIDKVGLAQEVRTQKLKEAQDIAEAVLDAEVRLGELMAQVPKATKGNQYTGKMVMDSGVHNQTKTEVIQNAGFTVKQAQRFETLAKHPEIVEQTKAEAREKDDIVSRSAVLKNIKETTHKQKRKEAIERQVSEKPSSGYVDIYTTENKYRVIYADPPWRYGDKQNIDGLGGAEKHYPTMSISELCNIPVPSTDNSVLFMWVTSPMLEDAFKVIKAWGYKYKSSFVWDKVSHNMGHYNSVRHELLLISTKGSCVPDIPKLYDSVVSIERTEHSRKPKEFRDIIDTLYPIGSRLEMFAREAPEGWDVWGNMA